MAINIKEYDRQSAVRLMVDYFIIARFHLTTAELASVYVRLKGVARLQFKRRQNRQVKRRLGRRGECGAGRRLDPPLPRDFFLLFDLKMEHFGAVFKPDLTEETRTQLQLQKEEALASSCLILATPMIRL